MERLARIYDAEILPVWSQRFGQMMLRRLSIPEKTQVLDVACGTGYPSIEILRRMGQDCRLIAIDSSSAMLDVARKKLQDQGKKVFFRTESMTPRLSFADDVYDLVVCNLGLEELEDRATPLAEFARVTKPGGRVMCTLPIEGTFQEFYDIYREVLTKHDKHDTLHRLAAHVEAMYPTVEQCERWLAMAGLSQVDVEIEEFTLLFRSSREFFFAPVIEFGPLPKWKRLAGTGQEMQDVFWYIKEAIDAYFEGRAFEVTIKAACLRGVCPATEELETGQVLLIDDLEEITQNSPVDDALKRADTGDVDEMAETIDRHPAVTEPIAEGSQSGSSVQELAAGEVDYEVEYEVEESDIEEVAIDAFAEGAERPDHLDED